MKISSSFCFLVFGLIFIQILQCSSKRVMPWMCLERCGGNSTTIKENLREIAHHARFVTGVSFEKYNLGANSALIINNLTDPTQELVKIGVETWPMVSSYPYPPSFLDWMRELFKNPDPFVNALLDEMNKYNYTGINIDFEPTATATTQDASDYANFLTYLGNKLHTQHRLLSVDIATWNPIWDWDLIGKASVDIVMTMSTYTRNDTIFDSMLKKGLASIGTKKLGIGLECDLNPPLNLNQLRKRISSLQQNGINEIDIWKMRIPDMWWPDIERFING